MAVNNTGHDITFGAVKVTWGSPTAYFEELEIKIEDGTDYHAVWDYVDNGNERWGSGETEELNQVSSVTVPKYYTAKIKLKKFKTARTGAGSDADMDATELTLDFYNGADHVADVVVEVVEE